MRFHKINTIHTGGANLKLGSGDYSLINLCIVLGIQRRDLQLGSKGDLKRRVQAVRPKTHSQTGGRERVVGRAYGDTPN